jgi:predicted MFS family arabinose efflux permease
MACTTFIGIVTETMPAGLLPQIAEGLRVSNGSAGQLVTAYAVGAVLGAIPAVMLTRGARRKPLLCIGLLGFLLANTATALAPGLLVALAVRFIAGAFSGLLWGMLAGYAMRITAPERAGRALAIAMAGIPLALAAGTPLGTWFGATVGWRWAFAGTSLFTVVILVSALILVPDAPGQHAPTRIPPLLAAQESTPLAILAIILWGLGFGGSATQLQTAAGAAAGEHADAAISMVTTAFNLAIFAAGAVGAVFVDGAGAKALPAVMIVLAAVALIAVGLGRRAAFRSPPSRL